MSVYTAKNEKDSINQSEFVLSVDGLYPVPSRNVEILVKDNIMPNFREFSVWVPKDVGLFTVEDINAKNNIQYGLLSSLEIPPGIEQISRSDNRNQLLTGWYAELYTACYLEIFKKYPELYPSLMKYMNISTYPALWTSQFNALMNDSILGKLESKYMSLGIINLPFHGGKRI